MKQVLQYILNHPLNNNRKSKAACNFLFGIEKVDYGTNHKFINLLLNQN